MAQRVDSYLPSDGHVLPPLDSLLKKPDTYKVRPLRNAVAPTPEREEGLIPKSSLRRVRRLGNVSQATTINPLFLPWNDVDDGSPRKQSSRAGGKTYQQDGQYSLRHASRSGQSSPLLVGRQSRTRQPRPAPLLDNKSDGNAAKSGTSLPARTCGSRSASVETTPSLAESVVKNNGEAEQMRIGVLQPETQHPYTIVVSDDEESSFYQTAAEEASEYDDSSGSEFGLDSFDKDLGEPLAKQPSHHTRQRQGAARNRPKEEAPDHGALKPCHASTRDREAVCDVADKVTCSGTSRRGRPSPAREASQNAASFDHASGISDALEKLQIQFQDSSDDDAPPGKYGNFITQPHTALKGQHPGGPGSPHTLQSSINSRHSPQKKPQASVTEPLVKSRPKGATKKSFDDRKHRIAEEFFGDLDAEITGGKITELTESTGGVKLVWSKTLNTTAGRAIWRRETVRTKLADGMPVAVTYRHHASIDLADKVIDDENRLLNVLAHEFCHLANFMISGITNKPHGKEFKSWATKCSRAFGDSRGIRVTTKHRYEIDFKYVWKCTTCGSEYKRHSKSIDPRRHRCGSCKNPLQQTKPVPRENGAGGRSGGKPSDYQIFVREQMKIMKRQKPGIPQKEVMKIVAGRWANMKKGSVVTSSEGSEQDGATSSTMTA